MQTAVCSPSQILATRFDYTRLVSKHMFSLKFKSVIGTRFASVFSQNLQWNQGITKHCI